MASFFVFSAISSIALYAAPTTIPTADELPEIKQLPDPFTFSDGSRVRNRQDWQRRREESKRLFQAYEYGHLPPKPEGMSIAPGEITQDAAAGMTRQDLPITLRHGDKQFVLRMQLLRPIGATGRLPVVIRPGFPPRPPSATQAAQPATRPRFLDPQVIAANRKLFADRGYAIAEFVTNDIARDSKEDPKDGGMFVLFGEDIDCGALMGWAWGFSRVIDALETRDDIDTSKIVVSGHSRWGKAALVAGAFDERITLTVPHHSGTGGAAPYRFLYGKNETIENIVDRFPRWFGRDFGQFIGKVLRLPFDQHELHALVAPRALMMTEGTEDIWINPQGSQLTYLAGKQVYEFLGAADRISIRFRPVGHIPSDPDLLDFADHIFAGRPLPPEFGQLAYPQEPAGFDWTAPRAQMNEPNSNQKRIALIFDDGPTEQNAAKLLEIFRREQIHVTFGTLAKNAQALPGVAKSVVAAGHELANHSFSHHHPKDLDAAALEHEIADAQKTIAAASGFSPKWYWPPYLEADPRHFAVTAKAGIQVFVPPRLVSSDDWKPEVDAATITKNATTNITDGTVILFHEWRNETVDELPAIISQLRQQGCEFLTFDELANGFAR